MNYLTERIKYKAIYNSKLINCVLYWPLDPSLAVALQLARDSPDIEYNGSLHARKPIKKVRMKEAASKSEVEKMSEQIQKRKQKQEKPKWGSKGVQKVVSQSERDPYYQRKKQQVSLGLLFCIGRMCIKMCGAEQVINWL